MKIFDFNIHLPVENDQLDLRLREDLTMSLDQFVKGFNHHEPVLKKYIQGMNLMLFQETNIWQGESMNLVEIVRSLRERHPHLIFTKLIDFRDEKVMDYMDFLNEAGIEFIKFHSYQQKIAPDDFDHVLSVSRYAQELGIGICVDTSFGTTGLYQYDNLHLAALICESIDKVPVVLLHSGGARAMDAMLIADLEPNVYLETSLTIPFFERSRIWEDLAFSYRKVGTERVLYGSDSPYVDIRESGRTHTNFFEAYNFSSEEVEQIYWKNTINLIEQLHG